jgi:glucan phosphoethanolaminetransferase (alkaline phosphatase superfamily)
MKISRNIAIVANILGALITLGIMVSTTSPVAGISDVLFTLGFYVWAVLPFIILLLLTTYIHRKNLSAASRVAILLTSILIVVSSVFLYWASIFNSESSTSALVFVFIPLYSLVGIAVIYGLAWLVLKFVMPRSTT